jgi:hypothetical protein
MCGTAHVVVDDDTLAWMCFRPDVHVLKESDQGDGTYLALVESTELPDGYQGVWNVVIADPVRFRKDADT